MSSKKLDRKILMINKKKRKKWKNNKNKSYLIKMNQLLMNKVE